MGNGHGNPVCAGHHQLICETLTEVLAKDCGEKKKTWFGPPGKLDFILF